MVGPKLWVLCQGIIIIVIRQLVNLPGSYYSDPVFSWYRSIGVTDIEFLKSSKLGEKYKNIYLLVILIMAIYITFRLG